MASNRMIGLVLILLSIWLSACTTTEVFLQHPAYAGEGEAAATVVFIRPVDQRSRGVADSDIEVEIAGEAVMNLSAGEHAALRIKPMEAEVVLSSLAFITSRPMPEKVHRSRGFVFEAGQTHYILTRFDQQEWRGFYFVPEEIGRDTAAILLQYSKAANELAKRLP